MTQTITQAMSPERRRTKIVATVGPASDAPATLATMIDAGVDAFRLGLAHGTIEEHFERIRRIRAAAADAGRAVGLLADLPGPKIRTGAFPEGGIFLGEGNAVLLHPGEHDSDATRIAIEYQRLLDDLEPGDVVVLGDGAVRLAIEDRRGDALAARVLKCGRVEGRPGAHLPEGRARVSAPTDEDLALCEQLAGLVDMVAVSFVRTSADLSAVHDALGGAGKGGPMVVAKIETRAAVDDLAAIVDQADAVMVARGDLGNELPIEDVPHLQKRIIRHCITEGVPVITATQMLESMVHAPSPTRAEASDVANAVFDGTDAVMLSGETAIGHDPIGVVRTMARLTVRAEREADYRQWGNRLGKLQSAVRLPGTLAVTAAMTHAAWRAADEVGASAILCCTRSGLTARAMARFRPTSTLVGCSPDPNTVQGLTLSWGVRPLVVSEYATTDDLVWCVVEEALAAGEIAIGDVVAVLAGAPEDTESTTDVLRLVRVEDLAR
ncbi:pyruvate kinase [soil metagenome]